MTMLHGTAWVFGDRIGIEDISPLRFMLDTAERAAHCLERIDGEFAKVVRPGDIIVAGSLFGLGPGHDHAILALKETGIAMIVARSFGFQFYRHAIDHGLAVREGDVFGHVESGEPVVVDTSRNMLTVPSTGHDFPLKAPEGPAADILAAGGLMPFLRRTLAGQGE